MVLGGVRRCWKWQKIGSKTQKSSKLRSWSEKFSQASPASGCESDENPTGWGLKPLGLSTQHLRPTANSLRPQAGQQAWPLASTGRSPFSWSRPRCQAPVTASSWVRAKSHWRWVLKLASSEVSLPLCLRIPPILHQGGNCVEFTKWAICWSQICTESGHIGQNTCVAHVYVNI